MSFLSKKKKTGATELTALADQHDSFLERLEAEYQSGLAILRRVRVDAVAEAEAAEAKGKLLLQHARSLVEKFTDSDK